MLDVVILEIGQVILGGQIFGDFVIGTGEEKLVALLTPTADRQPGAITGATPGSVLQTAGGQGQLVEIAAGNLAAFKGLWQQATVVRYQDRQLGRQRAVTHFGLVQAGFGGHAQAAPFIGSAITISRDHRAAAMAALAAVQCQPHQPQRIDAEPEGAVGETGGVIEHEPLRPFLGLALTGTAGPVAVVVVEVEVTQAQCGLAVANEIS
ncbi:hypothetical protein D3C78_416310 [compost metagenome]